MPWHVVARLVARSALALAAGAVGSAVDQGLLDHGVGEAILAVVRVLSAW